ncbi:MAG: peptidylprolyl isomerase [Bacteroidetes bacterium]|nr:peptidylprolyl isomerase [Bacteroidota bacterium]
MKRLIAFLSIVILLISCKQNNPTIVIETELGNITIELYEKQAPITTQNFIKYIAEKRYLGATFYRVVTLDNQKNSKIKIEVIQGGLYEDDHPQALPPIVHENTNVTGILHKDGVISMARYEAGTATFEFFICVGDQPSLDFGGSRNSDNHGFAAFGKVIGGMDVVRKIHKQPDSAQYLVPRIPITKMLVVY